MPRGRFGCCSITAPLKCEIGQCFFEDVGKGRTLPNFKLKLNARCTYAKPRRQRMENTRTTRERQKKNKKKEKELEIKGKENKKYLFSQSVDSFRLVFFLLFCIPLPITKETHILVDNEILSEIPI
jgi:hypothetical protein